MPSLKNLFLLDPEIHFLNHGSFGATPRVVFDIYQDWQRRLEQQPVLFLGREFNHLHQEARSGLGTYLNARPEDLVFIPNATYGVNIIARSLDLGPGDEVLTTDHEYGACDRTWDFLCQKRGAHYLRQAIPLPIASCDDLLEQFWEGVTYRTKVIYLSHITSPTALCFPVKEICRRARLAGIRTLIDGAHAPGQIPLDLERIGADFYTGNCHKWMMSPKGAGFLHAREEYQDLLEPLVVSWGYQPEPDFTTGSRYVDKYQWTGTRDPAAALSVPAAIHFMEEHRWDEVRQGCGELLRTTLERIGTVTGLPPAYPDQPDLFFQMGIARLPVETDIVQLKTRLYDEFKVEVPLIEWNGQKFIRVSIQGYNTPMDADALVEGLDRLLPETVGNASLPPS
jgi:isopenicillin-N epimerase